MQPEYSSTCPLKTATSLYSESDKNIPHRIFLRPILILSYHLCLGLSSGLFPSVFRIKYLYAFPFSPIRVTCPTHLILSNFIILIISGEQYNL
jgi:hypothetical protein